MNNEDGKLSSLLRELDFLDRGGYRVGVSWRPSLFFEDSPICTRQAGICKASCTLLSFVPAERCNEPAPCRYIRLNDKGETLDSMYRTATNEEIEDTVRNWLLSVIGELERPAEKTRVQTPNLPTQ